MKVIHIDSEMTWRGGQQQAFYLYDAMIAKGYQTAFFTPIGSALTEKLKGKNLPVNEISMNGEIDFTAAKKIAKFAKQHNFDILHCHSSHSLSVGIMASYFNKKLKLVASRRVDFRIKRNYLNDLKYLNKSLKKIICISEAIKQILLDAGLPESRLAVIRSGIDLNKFINANPLEIVDKLSLQNKFVIGTVAAVEREKNYPLLLEAAKLVQNSGVEAVFVAVGDGSLLQEMQQKAMQLELKNFYFEGYRTNIGDYLKAFDVFVLPSKKEGLGTSILDAMSVGLPIIASNIGGIPEAVENGSNGILIDPSNPVMLAKSIISLIDAPEKRKAYGAASLELVQKFDINNTINSNIELYKEILAE